MSKLWDVKHISKNPFSRPGRKRLATEYLVWHYTANPGASAEDHFYYFEGLKNQNPHDDMIDRYASAHLFIDRDSAVEIIPLDEEAFHAGDKRYNQRSIGIELCIEKDGTFHIDTIRRAIEIGIELCQKHGIHPLKSMIRHFDVTGKLCPRLWVERPVLFEAFKNDVYLGVMRGVKYKMNPIDANKIIDTYLKPAYGKAHKAGDEAGKKEAAYLADELRKASDQKTQNG